MKKRRGYATPLLALALLFSGEYSAHGQSQTGGLPSISVSSGVYPTESGIPDAVAAHRNSLRNILVLLKAKLIKALTLKDEKVISDVKGEVKDTLNEQFANDLAIREAKLAQLIERADNAAARNKQRLASKDEIIELQVQSYVMEKDSIGSSERDLELQNLFGSRRQTTADVVPRTATNPDNNGIGDLASEAPFENNPISVNETRVFIAGDQESELSVKMRTVLESRDIWLRGVHSGPLFGRGNCTSATVVESPEGLIGIKIAFHPNVLERLRNFTQYSPDALFAVAPTGMFNVGDKQENLTIYTVMTFVNWLAPDTAIFNGFRNRASAESVVAMLRNPTSGSTAADFSETNGAPAAFVPFFSYAPSVQQNRTSTIEAARMKLARASSADEESQATKELKVALDAYFDRDLEDRNRLLKNVRADIEKMKQKLEKRASSKSSIVELQFKMIVNEASGLGFFSPTVTTEPISAPSSFDAGTANDLLGSPVQPR